MAHTLTLWTNHPERAAWADRAGVERIGLDFETLGKRERQRGLPTWISPHTLADLAIVLPAVGRADIFVRCNPLHAGSRDEVETLIGEQVAVIMVPNFISAKEIESFLRMVDGRARVVPLIERMAALGSISDLGRLGITEIHIGLNDLAIDLKEPNRLVVLASPLMDRLAGAAHQAALRLGVGGLGRAYDDDLPVPSELVYAQHARLGASGALLARSFFKPSMPGPEFVREIQRLHARLAEWYRRPTADLERARIALLKYAGIAT